MRLPVGRALCPRVGQDGVVDPEGESRRTVLVAGAANLLIAIAKLIAGLFSGSSAMLAEAAHSVGDTLNQAFLLTALRRSQRPADRDHPFGYGMARYFWSLLAAVAIFVLGAGFAAYEGSRPLYILARRARPSGRSSFSARRSCFEGSSFQGRRGSCAPRRGAPGRGSSTI